MYVNSLSSTSTFSKINKGSSWFKFKNFILNKKNSFQKIKKIKTIKLDDYLIGGWGTYDQHVSDHRPVGIILLPNQ